MELPVRLDTRREYMMRRDMMSRLRISSGNQSRYNMSGRVNVTNLVMLVELSRSSLLVEAESDGLTSPNRDRDIW